MMQVTFGNEQMLRDVADGDGLLVMSVYVLYSRAYYGMGGRALSAHIVKGRKVNVEKYLFNYVAYRYGGILLIKLLAVEIHFFEQINKPRVSVTAYDVKLFRKLEEHLISHFFLIEKDVVSFVLGVLAEGYFVGNICSEDHQIVFLERIYPLSHYTGKCSAFQKYDLTGGMSVKIEKDAHRVLIYGVIKEIILAFALRDHSSHSFDTSFLQESLARNLLYHTITLFAM